HEREEDGDGRHFKAPVHGLHHREEPRKEVRSGKGIGQQVNAASSFDVVGLGTWHRSALLWWNVCRKIGQRGAGGLNLVADGNARAGTRRQVHVDARTETDEAVTLTRVE